MATVSSTSSSMSSALGVTGKGIGGLATGLDTDSLVAALTAGTKSKIAKQGQQKQLLNWKMTAYRSMATALNAFQTKFLKPGSSSASNTNITSSNFFSTYKASSSSDKVSVSATSGAATGNFTIDKVMQLATSESYTSTRKMSTTLSMDLNNIKSEDIKADMFKGQTLTLEVDGFSAKTIKLDSLNDAIKDGAIDMDKFKDGLQKLMNDAYKSTGLITVSKDGDGIKLDSNAKITVGGSNTLLGLDAGDSNRVDTRTTKIGDLDAFKNVQGDVLTFNINGVEISVNKRDDIDSLLSKVTNSGANVRMEYDKYNDVFTLTSKLTGADSAFEIRDVQGNLMSEIFGAKGGNGIGTDYLKTGDEIIIGSDFVSKMNEMDAGEKKNLADRHSKMSFSLTVNGVTKNVKIDTLLGIPSTDLANGTYDADAVYSAINKGIQSAFYGTSIEFGKADDGSTKISSSNGEAFSISASGEFATLLGLSDDGSRFTGGNIITDFGYSNKIASSAVDESVSTENGFLDVDKLDLSNPFQMTINGVTKDIIVKPAKDGNGADIEITNGNFLSRLNVAVQEAFGSDAAGVSFTAAYDIKPGSFATLKPEDYEKRSDGYYYIETGEKIFDLPPAEAEDQTGYYIGDRKVFDSEGFALEEDGSRVLNWQEVIGIKDLTLNVGTNYAGSVETSVSMSGALSEAMGFAPAASNASKSLEAAKLSDLKGGADMAEGTLTVKAGDSPAVAVEYKTTDTLESFLTKLNAAFGDSAAAGIKDGKLFIKSENGDISVTDTGDMLENIFGIKGGEYKTAAEDYTSTFDLEEVKGENLTEGVDYDIKDGDKFYKYVNAHKTGLNAELMIDGRKLEHSSNTINYNGVNLTLNDVSTEAIKIGVQADPDDVVTRIKGWMEDYNALVFTLNSALNESKNREYSPLTDEQKADMTDDQVKTWEAEAKKGVLRNDQTLRQILSDMRASLYEKVESAGISLYDIGIVTKSGLSDPNQAGQLEFDLNAVGGGEQRLRDMLINNPDKVRMLFTDSENGIGAKLNKVISQAASTSSVDRGTLVRIAGTEIMTGDNTSQLKDKIAALDKYIASLKTRLETEYNRYWKQFSSLETSVQKMNQQSSWLAGQ